MGIDGDNQCVKVLRCSPGDIEMAMCEWIEATRIHGNLSSLFIIAHAHSPSKQLQYTSMKRQV